MTEKPDFNDPEYRESLLNLFQPGRCATHEMPPLQYAVYNVYYGGKEPILKLLELGVDIDAADEDGDTALHQAVFEREPEVYALLVQAGANQHAGNSSGYTPAWHFEKTFGESYEEKFKGQTIDAAYFRRER